MGASINLRDLTPERPSFQRDIPGHNRLFANFPTSTSLYQTYYRSQQLAQMETILGQNEDVNGNQIIESGFSTSLYFARGHLAPDADFIYDLFQDATYYFVNVAPQFQSFNNGNWKALEGAVRDYAESLKASVKVITGTYGLLRFKNTIGKLRPFFLYTEDGNQWIPAPEYYWKVVHNEQTNEAIAFVGHNNPHSQQTPTPLCQSQCGKLSWADWNMDSLSSGFMYCCRSINGRSISPKDLALVEIGWILDGKFQTQVKICQDTRRYVSLWTKHSVYGKAIDFRDKTSDRPSFRRDITGLTRFFPDVTQTRLNEAYSKKSQVKELKMVLGGSFTLPNGEAIIDSSSSSTSYFAKGHLSPDAAFVYDVQQDATYYFMNVAPQFQAFNNGNWKALEGSVRDYAISSKGAIDIYTGTYGYLFYNKLNSDGSSKRTYIDLMRFGTKDYLPVPKYFWKVVHNPQTNHAIAFVGMNDAHLDFTPSRICSNVCDEVPRADWDMDNLDSGYMYCCKVKDLRDTVDYVPDLIHGSQVEFVCHGSEEIPSLIRDGQPSLLLTCDDRRFLTPEAQGTYVYTLKCSEPQVPKILRSPRSACAAQGADDREDALEHLALIQIGWEINGVFLEQIQLCVDELLYATLWTKHVVMGASINLRDLTPERPSFQRDIPGHNRLFANFPTSTSLYQTYYRSQQLAQMETILGQNEDVNGNQIIESGFSTSLYFARGHLAPDADFIYDLFQDATYYFVNVAPQFQSFNNGNWKALEGAVRDYAESLKASVKVITGTYGLLRFKNTIGKLRPFFLYTEDGNQWIPAPEYYWKVVHNEQTNEAIAFVGHNNPHSQQTPTPLCQSQCGKLSWADWNMDSLSSGFMYCCRSINGRSISPKDLALVEIGWILDGKFQTQVKICQDTRRYVSLWTKHSVYGKAIDFRDKTSDRPSFRRDITGLTRFFPDVTQTRLNEAYSKKSQVKELKMVLGGSFTLPNGEAIIDSSSSSTSYFAKGHLSPDAAFVYDVQQDATYYFMNVAPQFQAFNNGNWKALEGSVRDYAISSKGAIDIYTGTYGYLFYNKLNSDGSSKRTYIDLMRFGTKDYLPVPKYFWKVVHNPQTNHAIAFVGMNDAHLDFTPSRICSNVCDEVPRADWDMDNLDSGYMYCCKVKDLRDTVDYVPDLSQGTGAWPALLTGF
eukprot:maker-scaffold176_size284796-snap-gene-0.14 protein:Tk06847 transcript:maker-scaffold176_size284796-snap-gene-0.14-mRNA-1 annotation:"duplex-specific nuclease"